MSFAGLGDLNSAANSAAKHVVALRVGFSCNKGNLLLDCCTAFFFYLVFNEMAVYLKKKTRNPSLVSASNENSFL